MRYVRRTVNTPFERLCLPEQERDAHLENISAQHAWLQIVYGNPPFDTTGEELSMRLWQLTRDGARNGRERQPANLELG
jgi:hypothetical protein